MKLVNISTVFNIKFKVEEAKNCCHCWSDNCNCSDALDGNYLAGFHHVLILSHDGKQWQPTPHPVMHSPWKDEAWEEFHSQDYF